MTRRITLSLFTLVLAAGLTGCTTTVFSTRCHKPCCSGWSDDAYAKCGGKTTCSQAGAKCYSAGSDCSKCRSKCDKPCCPGKSSCKASCTKPCCAKKDACPHGQKCDMKSSCKAGCDKPCCAKKSSCKPGCDKPCCAKKACPPGCDKPCCAKKSSCKPGCDKPCCTKKSECGDRKDGCGEYSCKSTACPMFKEGPGVTVFNNERNEVHHWYWGRPPIKRVHLVETGEIGTWEYTPIWQDRLFYR